MTVGRLAEIVTAYFRERPLADEDGLPFELSGLALRPAARA